MKKLILFLFAVCFGNQFYGQTYNDFTPSKTQFMVRGYGFTGFNYMKTGDEKESSYMGSAFSPILLFKHSDKLMFEAEVEFEVEDNDLEIGLEYADVMYVLSKNMTIRAGKFLLPFGTFIERFHPAWINRLSSKPLGLGENAIAPESGTGVELRGNFDLGGPQINYSVYSTNGPRLKDGTEEAEAAGLLDFKNFEDNNLNKAFGGRLGVLPFSDSSTELGFSAYTTGGAGGEDTDYENTGAFLYALDLSYVKQISPLKGMLDVKAQYNHTKVDDANYLKIQEDGTAQEYTFDNQSEAFYTQLSYRPTMAEGNFFRKLEFVGRYSGFNAPEGAEWEETSDQYAFGINYWLTWRSVIKVNYQTTDTNKGQDSPDVTTNGFFVQWAIGL